MRAVWNTCDGFNAEASPYHNSSFLNGVRIFQDSSMPNKHAFLLSSPHHGLSNMGPLVACPSTNTSRAQKRLQIIQCRYALHIPNEIHTILQLPLASITFTSNWTLATQRRNFPAPSICKQPWECSSTGYLLPTAPFWKHSTPLQYVLRSHNNQVYISIQTSTPLSLHNSQTQTP